MSSKEDRARLRAHGNGLDGRICAVLTTHDETCDLVTSKDTLPCSCGAESDPSRKETFGTKNLLTTAGLVYYAQLMAGETPTNTFDALSVRTNSLTPAADDDYSDLTIPSGGEAAVDSGNSYPKTNDGDAANTGTTGTTTVSWNFDYGTSDAVATLLGGAIHDATATGTDPLLNSFNFSSPIVKSNTQTLAVYVNHTLS